METCDVLIVGGGPGGSACARKLRDGGANVVVLDKRRFPRDKTCAGWITPQVVEALRIDLDEYGRHRVMQPITGFRSGLIDGSEIHTEYGKTVSYGIRRCEFDHYLLDRSGVRCRLGEPVVSISRRNDRWIVNDELAASVVVGAGGHFCPVARLLGARVKSKFSVVAAQEAEFPLKPAEGARCRIQPEVPEVFFCRDLKGYGWCFRKGPYLNIGLGRVDKERISAHVESFCRFLRRRDKIGFDVAAPFHGHAYQLYERNLPTLVGDGMLLVGDAAGLAYPQSGEGIRPAIESGLIAADVIIQAAGRYDRDALQPYCQRVISRLGKPRSPGIAGWLPNSWMQAIGAQLLCTRWFSRRVVLDRWFLHSQQPTMTV